MSTIYHIDPDTGVILDVVEENDLVVDDDDNFDEPRNARPIDLRDHRQSASRRQPAGRGRPAGRRRPSRSRRYPQYYPRGPRPQPQLPAAPSPVIVQPRPVTVTRDHFTIRKSALVEFIPAIGQVWASFLGVPDAPRATGDDITDRDNASAHRESLARHTQNQTRILALTELASKAVKVFTE